MIILNSELRVPVTGALQVVSFLDAGSVFDRVSNLSLGRIRGGAGFGVRYRSPVGPIRVDLGLQTGPAGVRRRAGAANRPACQHRPGLFESGASRFSPFDNTAGRSARRERDPRWPGRRRVYS